jgi:hypothetical protein
VDQRERRGTGGLRGDSFVAGAAMISGRARHTGRMPAGGLFGYLDFAYAIPTDVDTILVVGGSEDVNDATVQRAVDELVRSMEFGAVAVRASGGR